MNEHSLLLTYHKALLFTILVDVEMQEALDSKAC
jgi:hypothetical protein